MAALTFFYIQLTYHYLFLSVNNNSVSHCRFLRRYSRLTLHYINKTCVNTPSSDVLQKLHTNRLLCFESPPNHPSSSPATVTAPHPKTKRKKPRGTRGGRNRRHRRITTVIDVFDRSARADTCRGLESADRDPEMPAPPADTPLPHTRSIIKRDAKVSRKMKLMVMNVQSVGENAFIIREIIEEENVDIAFITETWFNEGDNTRLEAMKPNSFGKAVSFPRIGRGGGIAIISKQAPFSSSIDDFPTFEATQSNLRFNNNNYVFFCIYRPPPSKKNKLTVSDFISDFTTFLDSVVLATKKLFVVVGDINIHFDDKNNT